jgi:HAD superfamily hydrolase (TIGR01509 family)
MIEAVVFDFDGVLADSEVLHLRAYQQVLAPYGITLSRADYYSTYLGFDDDGVFRAIGAANGWVVDDREVARLIAEKSRVFDALEAEADVLYPGAAACIETLSSRFPLGIASGALRHEIDHVLSRARLLDRFRFIVAAGDTARGKPSPDPYRRAAELHGLPPGRCVAIEDSAWGIASAKDAGLYCVGITNSYARDALGSADAIVDTLGEFTPQFIASLGRP